ncbi:response regulator [Patescibacteria group bacterium]|nr:response regulator [Patescibacteria group bacterium]
MAKTILVVDDDDGVREELAELIELPGRIIVIAKNPEEALRLIDGGLKPHLIISDLNMPPYMDGFTMFMVIRRLKRFPFNFILMSARDNLDGVSLAELSRRYSFEFISKGSLRGSEILPMVARLLESLEV